MKQKGACNTYFAGREVGSKHLITDEIYDRIARSPVIGEIIDPGLVKWEATNYAKRRRRLDSGRLREAGVLRVPGVLDFRSARIGCRVHWDGTNAQNKG